MRGNHEIAAYTGNLARKIVAFALIAPSRFQTGLAEAIVRHAINKLGLQTNLTVRGENLQFIECCPFGT
ncbi:hypothetical protein KEJ37_03565 [Candidatus Bathyarchaeota archaeon]|nr:hypothetical protein [Candidatus Bathyarchaeota archaeon]